MACAPRTLLLMGEGGASNESGQMGTEEGESGDCSSEGGPRPNDTKDGGRGGGFFAGAESVFCLSSNHIRLKMQGKMMLS